MKEEDAASLHHQTNVLLVYNERYGRLIWFRAEVKHFTKKCTHQGPPCELEKGGIPIVES